MKRTNLVLDEVVLEEAVDLLKAKTYSEAVNKALKQSIQLAKIRGLLEWRGQGIWEGNLSTMRGDNKPRS